MKAEQAYQLLAEAIEKAPVIPPCQVSDPEVWFAEKGDHVATKKAKQLCSTCPVVNECLTYALQAKELYGVWGGLTSKERSTFRAARGAKSGRNKANAQIFTN